jgi:hypothetical protein
MNAGSICTILVYSLSEYVKRLSAKHTDYVYINHIRNHHRNGIGVEGNCNRSAF